MNYSVLPDLLAIGILIAVFSSVLERKLDAQSHYWLTGWCCILVHFFAQLVDPHDGTLHKITLSISLSMLVFAGSAFIAATYNGKLSKVRQTIYSMMINGPSIVFLICFACGVQTFGVYLAISVATLGLGLVGLYAINDYSPIAQPIIIFYVVQRLLQIAILYFFSVSSAAYWILFDTYLAAAHMLMNKYVQERKTNKSSLGIKVVIISFFTWAVIYLAEPLLTVYAPKILLETEVRNLPKFLVAVGMILALLEQQVSHHEHLALHDELTGLPNRRLFEDRLQQAMDRAQRLSKHVALLTIDLDDFKRVNDTFGHPGGDVFLKAVAGRFQQIVRKADTIARTGGDEFSVVICDLPGRETAQIVINALQRSILDPVMINDVAVPISVSVGMALYDEEGDTMDALISAADAAMYRAKQQKHSARRAGLNVPNPLANTARP